MKKLLSIILALSMCISLAACGGDAPAAEQNPPSDVTADGSGENVSDTVSDNASLPMNVGEAYTCNIGGYAGYVSVSDYETVPDEMNEGCEIRTASVIALFPGAPKSHNFAAVAFPASGSPEAVDESAWMIETEYGENLIFEYDNITVAEITEGDVLRYDITLSYMVPEDYDEIAIAFTDSSNKAAFETLTKADMVFEDTRWFLMGSYGSGVLTYNGNAVATAVADVDINEMYSYGAAPEGWASEEIYEDFYEEPYEENSSAAGYRTLQLIPLNAVTECSSDGRTISFGAIELAECYEDTNIINVTVNYSGHKSGDTIQALLFDAYSEVHLDEQIESASGNGYVTFVFSCPAATAPYTFSVITMNNGAFIQNNIHIDADVF